MKFNRFKLGWLTLLLLAVVALAVLPRGGLYALDAAAKEVLNVVATTSLIKTLVEEIAKTEVKVTVIVPAAACPGHFDITPGAVKAVADAELLLMHGWEGEKLVPKLIEASGNSDLKVVAIELMGNWMVPDVAMVAIDKIADILADIDPANCDYYQFNRDITKLKVKLAADELRRKATELAVEKVNAIAALYQKQFVVWVGFNVVADYGRPEELTPKKVKEIIDKAVENEVALVIDNLQSGPDAGKAIAEQLDAVHVVLSNFPGAYEGTETYVESLKYNASLLFNALKEYQLTKATKR